MASTQVSLRSDIYVELGNFRDRWNKDHPSERLESYSDVIEFLLAETGAVPQ